MAYPVNDNYFLFPHIAGDRPIPYIYKISANLTTSRKFFTILYASFFRNSFDKINTPNKTPLSRIADGIISQVTA